MKLLIIGNDKFLDDVRDQLGEKHELVTANTIEEAQKLLNDLYHDPQQYSVANAIHVTVYERELLRDMEGCFYIFDVKIISLMKEKNRIPCNHFYISQNSPEFKSDLERQIGVLENTYKQSFGINVKKVDEYYRKGLNLKAKSV